MSGDAVVAIVVVVFFVIGVSVGVIGIIALSTVRRGRALPRPAPEESRPPWPGGTDNG